MKHITKIITVLLFFGLILTFDSQLSYSRPGGGHSYSSGSHSYSPGSRGYHSSGSYSSSGGISSEGFSWEGLLFFTVFMIFAYGIYYLSESIKKKRNKNTIVSKIRNNSTIEIDTAIEKLKEIDPNFSRVLFLDFVEELYQKYMAYSYTPDFKSLKPFFNDETIIKKAKRGKRRYFEVVVGSIDITKIVINNKNVEITVRIMSNYTTVLSKNRERNFEINSWVLKRNKNILSLEPQKMQRLSCPSCGSVEGFDKYGKCLSCGTKIKQGEMQWFVYQRYLEHKEELKTAGLVHYEQEKGTDKPTVFNYNLNRTLEKFAQIHNLDPISWSRTFRTEIAQKYFLEIYKAWSQNKLSAIRHLISDRTYNSFVFWIEMYQSEGWQNKLDDLKITKIELAKLELDKFYEAATVRIFAECKDYVVDKQGKIVGGDNKKVRKFSEYWTFVRRSGVERDAFDITTCPSCGAPIDKIGQTGVCEYCNTKVTTGEFSWVLAIITQDDDYIG